MRLIGEPVLPSLPLKMPVPPPLPQGVTFEALVDDQHPHPQRAAWIMEWEWRLDFNRRIDEAQERIERCSKDILEFGKEYFPDLFSQPFGKFHREMSDLVFNLDPAEWFYQDKHGNQLQKQGVVVAAPRGHGKCLSGLTNVTTYAGRHVLLRDITVGQEIVSLNQTTLRFERDIVVAKEHTGTKPVIRIRTRTGKELTLTREHRVFTYGGWKVAGELSLADRIAAPRQVPIAPTVLGRQDAEVQEWQRLEGADVSWDQIVAIEDAGICDTYDIQVAKNENFISNGLVTHNSAWMTFLLPIYCAVFRIKHFVVIFSNNRDGVTLFCTQIKREIEENEKLRADFGNLSGKVYGRPWGAFTFVICHPSNDDSSLPAYETMIAGRSVGTNVRGMRFGAHRPSLVLGDDLEKDENVQTAEQRGKMQALLTQRIMPMLDPADGLLFICGTIFHYDSLLARLLKPESGQGWVQRIWKCILPPATDVLDEDAIPLWPERWPINALRSKRLTPPMTLHEWNTEWMNDPSDPESREYKPEWFRWYSRSRHLRYNKKEGAYEWCKPGDVHPLTGQARWQKLFIYQAVDPAPGLNKENDYFAMLTGGISALTHDVVIIHLVRGHFPFAEQVNVIEGQFMQFPMTVGCAIETENYQDVLRQTIINRQARRYGVRRVPVKGIKQKRLRDSKVGRLRRRAWDMQTGTVWFPAIQEGTAGYADAPYSEPTPAGERVRVHPLVYPLYREMIEFPKSRNDDTLDTFDMLLSVIGKRRIFSDQAAAEKDEILAEDNPLVRPRARTPVVPGIAANGSAGVVQVDRRNNRRRTGRATPVLS